MLNLPVKNYVVVGSYAMMSRPINDLDIICYEADVQCEYNRKDEYSGSFSYKGRKVELLFADKQESLQLILEAYGKCKGPVPLYILYALKAGHITYPNRNWSKHIADYHVLRNSAPDDNAWIQLGERYIKFGNFVKLHKKCTEERIGKQRLPKLKGVSKSKFFDDKVVKYYEHDDIHQWFAHKDKPMYTYMQKDETVECHKDLWESFTLEEKLQCVMEECYVIASERHLIPMLEKSKAGLPFSAIGTKDAFTWALMRVCTTLCSGWFRQFAIDNYFKVLNNYNVEYAQILNKHIK